VESISSSFLYDFQSSHLLGMVGVATLFMTENALIFKGEVLARKLKISITTT